MASLCNASRRTSGFTLTEMLATMLIMVLASTLLATGIPVAVDTYQKTVNSANAQVALSTVITILRSEYGLTSKVMSSDAGDEVYFKAEEGIWATIRNPKSGESYRGLVKEYFASDSYENPDTSNSLGTYPLIPNAALMGANKPLEMRMDSMKETGDAVSISELVITDGANELARVDLYEVATRFAN